MTYGTADFLRNAAVTDVTATTTPTGETTAKALVVSVDAGGGGGGTSSFVTTGAPFNASATDGDGTITSGGVSQTLFALNATRKGFFVQNQSAGDLYIVQSASAATADQQSLRIPSGLTYNADYISGAAVQIIGATTGQAFHARSW